MKLAPVHLALSRQRAVRQTVVHTGQHYDPSMSDVFFEELEMDPPVNLQVGSGSHAQQTAEIMVRFERALLEVVPDVVLIYGDVNSTAAAALVCAKLGVRVGHVEAGLRSFDRSMPEEINRIVADQLSDLLFTPSEDANANLLREGVAPGRVHCVGNVMIDTLQRCLRRAQNVALELPERYVLVTLHRPANVDDSGWLREMFRTLSEISRDVAIVFPAHPRTRLRLREAGIDDSSNGRLRVLDPMPYLSFLKAQQNAFAVVTDSGGVQEETTCLGIPCLTVRENTERPITVTCGTNTLVGRSAEKLRQTLSEVLVGRGKKGRVPPLWDGRAAERIAKLLVCS